MEIKHNEIEVIKENPFAECKLEREQYANILSKVINNYADGFVLAINNEWGTGKTTFVKMWQQALKNEGFKTIYFNAWENDFDNNSLVALMSELKTLTNKKNDKIFKSVVEKGAILARNVLPALAKSLVKKHTGVDMDMIIEGVENVAKGVTEILEKEINEYTTKKKTVLEFKKELEKFIKKTGNDKPFVFIIDELDRCRPDYAVEVLEQVKHFFSVYGIVFVLSIDKNHLASSIKGYYGSNDINTDEYLRRFIDLEYSIPKPSTRLFCGYLYNYYSFDDFYSSDERKKYSAFSDDSTNLLKMAVLLFDKSNATLRQQEKIFALTRLVLSFFKPEQHTFPTLLFVLIYFKTMKNKLYEEIKNNIYSVQELCNIFENFISIDFSKEYSVNLLYVEALLLIFYNNNKDSRSQEKLFDIDTEGEKICLINSKFQSTKRNLVDYFTSIFRESFENLQLSYILKKIDLIEPIDK